jgi:hypothetical protein
MKCESVANRQSGVLKNYNPYEAQEGQWPKNLKGPAVLRVPLPLLHMRTTVRIHSLPD